MTDGPVPYLRSRGPTTSARERAACSTTTTGSGRVDPTRWPASPTPSTASIATGSLHLRQRRRRGAAGLPRGGHARPAVLRQRSRALRGTRRRGRRSPRSSPTAGRACSSTCTSAGTAGSRCAPSRTPRGLDRDRPGRRRARTAPTSAATTETRQLTAVLEALPSATVLVDGDGRILTANRAWVANGELLRSAGIEPGGVGDDYLASMSRGLRPDRPRRDRRGLTRLQAEPVDASGRLLRLRVLGPARLVRHAGSGCRRRGSRARRGSWSPTPTSPSGCATSRRWPGRPGTTS